MDYAIIVGLLLSGFFLLYMARWLLSEHFMARAVAAVVFGLVILGATFIRVIPAMTDTENAKLDERIAILTKENGGLKSDKSKLEADGKRLAAETAATTAKLSDSERKRTDDIDLIQRDLGDLRRQLGDPSTGLVVGRAMIPERGDPTDKVRADIRSLSSLRAAPAIATPVAQAPAPVAVAAAPEPSRELTQLRDKMSARLSTPNYDVEVYPDKELVRGRQGRYYVVDMKNATSGIRYYYPGGKYVLSVGNQEFRTSLNTFVADILSKFEGKVRYDLFVRGTADGKPYEGRLEPGYEFRTIKYVRSLGGDKYGADIGQREVSDKVRNADLPDLRAAFMQKLISDIYPLKKPIILEGTVTAKTDDRDRNAELILFVDW
jgi:hypothetical protein